MSSLCEKFTYLAQTDDFDQASFDEVYAALVELERRRARDGDVRSVAARFAARFITKNNPGARILAESWMGASE